MGTNYYARTVLDNTHIGKASSGWTFSFHATDKIKSYKQWLKILDVDYVKIYNEYGELLSLDEFKAIVKNKEGAEHKHCIECAEDSYMDDEGHSFTSRSFS